MKNLKYKLYDMSQDVHFFERFDYMTVEVWARVVGLLRLDDYLQISDKNDWSIRSPLANELDRGVF